MQIEIEKFLKPFETVAVALSGGSDSMALLDYLVSNADRFNYKVVAINVEHGIRGDESKKDSLFVKEYCEKISVPLFCYEVDSPKKSKDDKLTLEQAARALRYECFYDAIESGKCDKVATAHHGGDNTESVLLNLFRGTGVSGLTGIKENFDGKIIRPFLGVKKEEITEYIESNQIPFVTDQSNFDDNYTRNFLRLKVIPKIKEVFPEVDQSIKRLVETVTAENEFMEQVAENALQVFDGRAEIKLPVHCAVFMRATINALKSLGVKKDWERVHLLSVYSLLEKENGASVDLPKGITASREYDKIVFAVKKEKDLNEFAFGCGRFDFGSSVATVKKVNLKEVDLKSRLIIDAGKVPCGAVIRTKRDGDTFKKFGGGTKSLGDFLTDKKIPKRERDTLPLLAVGNTVLAVFGVAISEQVKVDDLNACGLQLIKEDNYNGND